MAKNAKSCLSKKRACGNPRRFRYSREPPGSLYYVREMSRTDPAGILFWLWWHKWLTPLTPRQLWRQVPWAPLSGCDGPGWQKESRTLGMRQHWLTWLASLRLLRSQTPYWDHWETMCCWWFCWFCYVLQVCSEFCLMRLIALHNKAMHWIRLWAHDSSQAWQWRGCPVRSLWTATGLVYWCPWCSGILGSALLCWK